MCGQKRTVPMGFTEEQFPSGTHMCLIYNNEEERRQVIFQFLASGLASGERVGYFADMMNPGQVVELLEEIGVQRDVLDDLDKFTVSEAKDVYCPDGQFVPERMLQTLRNAYDSCMEEGFIGTRVSGEMSWALKELPGSDRLMEYEALVNNVLVTHPVTAICQYDANRFDGATIVDVLNVHPMMIVRGQIVHNPYYMKPEDFLKDFRQRG